MITTRRNSEAGFAAVWTAIVLLFLMGAAALAVDASEFWQQARSEQKAADLACMAGVPVLASGSPVAAMTKAAEFVRPNLRGLSSLDPSAPTSASANSRSWTVGDFQFTVQAVESTQLKVTIQQSRSTRFARALGFQATTITQQATCELGSPIDFGELPLAISSEASCLNNTFGGSPFDLTSPPIGLLPDANGYPQVNEDDGGPCQVKFSPGGGGGNDCKVEGDLAAGNCGAVDVPRGGDSCGNTSNDQNDYRCNLATGSIWDLAGLRSNSSGGWQWDSGHSDRCRPGGAGSGNPAIEPCGQLGSVTGNKPNHLTIGLLTGSGLNAPGRLARSDDTPPIFTTPTVPGLNLYFAHRRLDDVADCSPACGNGEVLTGLKVAHVTEVTDCNDPRWTSIPIVTTFTQGSLDNEYLFSTFAWIQEPDLVDAPSDPVHPSDPEFVGGGNPKLQITAVRILDFPNGADTTVEGDNCGFYPYREGGPGIVRLIPNS